MNLISAHALAKGFAGRSLFQNLNFGVEEKTRAGLVGPNGAGKSTLLKLIAGTLEPDAGSVARKRGLKVGFLEQMPEFAPGVTIEQAISKHAGDPHESHARVAALMAQLSLGRFGLEFEARRLSGGWQKRVALAGELLLEPDLLLLDEPTNHLDVSGILWLEDFLARAPFAVLMITHDRLFLQRTVNRILDLDPRNPNDLLDIRGGYLEYLEAKELALAGQARRERVLKNDLRREREWLSRGPQARLTKQKARSDAAIALIDTVDDLKAKNRSARMDLEFGADQRAPKRLIEAEKITKGFNDQTLFEDLDLLITPRTRLALLGDNGCGKSTLVRVLLGLEEPSAGTIRRADPLEVAYFEQGRETLDPRRTVMRNICPEGEYVSFAGEFVHVRSYLDRFLFQGAKAEILVEKISGGEKARLRLAQLMLQPAQLLVLDEPTNDLDADTLEVLESALTDFPGAVVLVTHDRYFMDAVANEILAFPLKPGHLEKFASYFQWETWFKEQTALASKSSVPVKREPAATPKTKLSYKDKFELEQMENVILALEGEIEILTAEANSALSDHVRVGEVHRRLAEKQAELDAKFERWSELEAKAKGLTGV